ncbi:CBS domain-containing protein [Candidatus Woesearchaeota archaeon]|nr:CBS domain-containing protein [Candidatus Woesearchaeota archaeon]
MDLVRDIMTYKVQISNKQESIFNIARMMYGRKIGSVVVVEGPKPIGIITERDLAYKVVANNIQPKVATAKDIMTSPLISIRPGDNIYYAYKIMNDKGIKKLTVVDENGNLVGILTQTDMINFFNKQRKEFIISAVKGKPTGSYALEG